MSVEIAFDELFFGSGSWLGLLLLLTIIILLSAQSKFVGGLMIPVSVFIGISYLSYPSLMWNALIMFLCSIMILIHLAQHE